MKPGEQITYKWMSQASPNTFAVAHEQLAEAGRDFEYVSWDIIVPIRRLEIEVVVRTDPGKQVPPSWFEIWQIGHKRSVGEAQTTYRTFLDQNDEPGHVQWHAELKPEDRLKLFLHSPIPGLR